MRANTSRRREDEVTGIDTMWARLRCEQNEGDVWTSQQMTLPEIAKLLANNQTNRALDDKPCPGPHTIVDVEPWIWDGAGPQ